MKRIIEEFEIPMNIAYQLAKLINSKNENWDSLINLMDEEVELSKKLYPDDVAIYNIKEKIANAKDRDYRFKNEISRLYHLVEDEYVPTKYRNRRYQLLYLKYPLVSNLMSIELYEEE